MARAIWTGSISFGLVSVPVRLHPATSPKDVRFHEVDRQSGRRVRRRSYVGEEEPLPSTDVDEPGAGGTGQAADPVEDAPSRRPEAPPARPPERTVAREEVVKAFEVEPGRVVELDPEEIERARPEPTRTIEIEHFVDLAEVDPVFFEKSYHLAPAGDIAVRPYALLRLAMERSGRVAIGRFVLRTKEHLVAVRPTQGILGLETLYFADEVNQPEPAWIDAANTKAAPKEIELSVQLIEALTTDWDPQSYEDRDRLRLMELIGTKHARDVEPESPGAAAAAGPTVPDLMEALRESVEAVRQRRGRSGARKRSGGRGAT